MKKKLGTIVTVGVGIALMVVGVVYAAAGYIGNVDGVWEYIEDDTDGTWSGDGGEGSGDANAWCTTYGTGFGNSTTARSRNNPGIQSGPVTDENQVRYGFPSEAGYTYSYCPNLGESVPEDYFNGQSGLGFDGVEEVGPLEADTPFLVGRATHYNLPINLPGLDTADYEDWRFMDWVDIDIDVTGVECPGGDTPTTGDPPVATSAFTFTYRINFFETFNSPFANPGNTCPYGPNVPYNANDPSTHCYDRIEIDTINLDSISLTCEGGNVPAENEGVYTLQMLGMIPDPNNDGDCSDSTYNPNLIQTTFTTVEQQVSHACVWAIITDFNPTAVSLLDFAATGVDEGVALTWETTSETNTLGFNVFRSFEEDGVQFKLNGQLIPNQMSPGSNLGGSYTFIDDDVEDGTSYYYWLQEVELDGDTILYGPAEITLE